MRRGDEGARPSSRVRSIPPGDSVVAVDMLVC